ncbi:MAG: NAD-dependent epimerase/dehydratase family protein [Chloroflexota bacterium]
MTIENKALHVIFGTGPVGLAIMDELYKQQEVAIRLVNRSGKVSEPLPEGVELVNGDASDKSFAIQAAQRASVIYFALNPPYHLWTELFPQLQEGVIAAAEAHKAKLVVMENVYMYGDTNGQPLHESLPHKAHTRKGSLRAKMHATLMEAHNSGRICAVVGRASDFYGPRVTQSAGGETIFGKLAVGKSAQFIGDPDQPHTYTYMPDVGKALVMLGQNEDVFGEVWHIPNAPAMTTRKLVELAATEFGTASNIQAMPKWMVRIMGMFVKTLGEFPEMMYEFEQPFIVENNKFEQRFGVSATPMLEGIRATVEWYKREKM